MNSWTCAAACSTSDGSNPNSVASARYRARHPSWMITVGGHDSATASGGSGLRARLVEDLYARDTDCGEIFDECAQQQQVDQVPLAIVLIRRRALLADGVELLRDLVADRQARQQVRAV